MINVGTHRMTLSVTLPNRTRITRGWLAGCDYRVYIGSLSLASVGYPTYIRLLLSVILYFSIDVRVEVLLVGIGQRAHRVDYMDKGERLLEEVFQSVMEVFPREASRRSTRELAFPKAGDEPRPDETISSQGFQ